MNVLLTAALLLIAAEPGGYWPGFLGGGRPRDLVQQVPLKWSPTENIVWQAKLPGHGQSSPIVWEDKVFVTAIEGPDKDKCHLICLSLSDGKQLWQHTIE